MTTLNRNILMFAAVLSFFSPAAGVLAEDTALRFGLSHGSRNSTAVDLYLQHSFDPWLDREAGRLSPFANLGFTHWFGDKKDAPDARNDRVWGLVAAVGLRYELTRWESLSPFLALSAGPSYISEDEFMGREMGGGHYLFNLRASLGLGLGEESRHRLSLDASHYSNCFTQKENNGYNALGFSYGYSFR